MAQTKKKRRRKHRGTQAGTIERAGRTGRPGGGSRPAPKGDARAQARERREARFDKEPTWRSSVNRAAIAAVILTIFVGLTSGIAEGVVLGAVAMILYVPMSYYMDRALWRRRQRQKQAGGR